MTAEKPAFSNTTSLGQRLKLRVRQWWTLRRLGHSLAGAIALLAAAGTAAEVGLVQLLERQNQAFFFEVRGPRTPPQDIVILAIDEQSIQQGKIHAMEPERYPFLAPLQSWPWQRTAYAIAIERLLGAGAKAVGVDVIFDAPGIYGEADDERFAKTLARYRSQVTLAAQFEEGSDRGGYVFQLTEPQTRFLTGGTLTGYINYPLSANSEVQELNSRYLWHVQRNNPDHGDFLQTIADDVPSFDQAVLASAQASTPPLSGSDIFFYGPSGTFEQIPFWHVLDPSNWNTYLQSGAYFKDKIVLIGATAASAQDFHNTPFGLSLLYPQPMAGIEIHANGIATLLEGRAIGDLLPGSGARGGLVLVLVLGASALLSRQRRLEHQFLWLSALVLTWLIGSYSLFTYAQRRVPTATPILAIALGGFGYMGTTYWQDQQRRRQLRRTLKHYAGAPLVQEILGQQDDFQDLLAEREQEVLGKLLGNRYRVLKVLGSGGFSATYIAEDTQRPGTPQCVVKQLRPASNDVKVLALSRRLFEREAATLEKLGKHDQIPQLLAYFEEDAEFYLIQEFIIGHPLSEELPLGKQIPSARVLRMLEDLLEVLIFVHHHGVIHRDIKPNNIIRRHSDNRLVLIDFGAVKEMQTQASGEGGTEAALTIGIGTRGYMPSEQCAGMPRFTSDLYAVGMTAIQALTGLPPDQLKEDPKTGDLVWQHRARVSHELAMILSQMVRYDFKLRYQSADEALAALRSLQSSGAIAEESEPETAVSGNFANALDDGEDERPSTLLWPEGFDTAQVSEEPETAIAPDASPPST